MLSLRERVDLATIPGPPNECWAWTLSTLPNGRPRLGIRLPDGRATSVTVARVIVADVSALPLFDTDAPKWVARHSCDNVACVNPAHILAGTYKENTADMWDRGRGAHGDRRSNAVLDVDKVHDIRAALAAGESQASIGRRYGLDQSHIGQVARRVIWAWVE